MTFGIGRRRMSSVLIGICTIFAATTSVWGLGPLDLLPPKVDGVGSVNLRAVLRSPAVLKILLARPELLTKFSSPLAAKILSASGEFESAFFAANVIDEAGVLVLQTARAVEIEALVKDFSEVP